MSPKPQRCPHCGTPHATTPICTVCGLEPIEYSATVPLDDLETTQDVLGDVSIPGSGEADTSQQCLLCGYWMAVARARCLSCGERM